MDPEERQTYTPAKVSTLRSPQGRFPTQHQQPRTYFTGGYESGSGISRLEARRNWQVQRRGNPDRSDQRTSGRRAHSCDDQRDGVAGERDTAQRFVADELRQQVRPELDVDATRDARGPRSQGSLRSHDHPVETREEETA
ncbi:MAG: hypothetical protein A3I07_03655 [Candidatus Doudnabacteria bacterium RIFCSPLOWO2_02_FULL_42_9]|uniref:Uncharacterized protein n=1 Tax=Candidatus Doudnabacteria bacterium RIFCSPHIGHO2_01_FULL_41_86 TaxID=1817821 RepID=A0A1F5N9W4_9BACT|nr:MAG: hypothetical protein A2717_02375 [Candidatus Doudnabacteria bacterium RIFCSPHIGHO2_01_FULL_41_86]OGE75607.1 MAG: hypothetical protein A3K07_02135 [Candidatus Doudnabacteria bacterium RIFCSPHIGHO2_01_43_10]OGE85402.1 MAG: hypothetical protein A3E28_01945 [Candidatus Doudnabacteria bacterium RIFCSPHIGHO2_12_FULL_42_22]OGE86940.1 MAG: hypothetical protein A3C49_02780 [Candidatus Doudnabacteria bacterium RIFCSPHIGHO2_02_FULL_42_25]OGE92539.1 MAG: hypothetical protein A2895_02935 [Candidatus